MHKTTILLFLLFGQTFSQNDILQPIVNDSSIFRLSINPLLHDNNLFLQNYDFFDVRDELFNNLVFDSSNIITSIKGFCIYSDILDKNRGFKPSEMISPLTTKYYNENKNSGYKYILGMFQTAAVGYLAYKHISKYGFFKKKESD